MQEKNLISKISGYVWTGSENDGAHPLRFWRAFLLIRWDLALDAYESNCKQRGSLAIAILKKYCV